MLVSNKDCLYLGNSCCHSVCILTDIRTDHYYIRLQIQFHCTAYRIYKCDQRLGFLIKTIMPYSNTHNITCTRNIYQNRYIVFHCIAYRYISSLIKTKSKTLFIMYIQVILYIYFILQSISIAKNVYNHMFVFYTL